MNWRSWFPQKDVFLIEGREVVLLNRTRLAFPPELKTIILSYCSQEKIVRSLPKVTFTLRSWDGALAQINNHQLQKRRLVIEINAGRIYGPESEQYWKRIIVHELTHLLHDYVSGTIRDYYSVSKRLDKSLIQLRKQNRIDFLHEDLRVLLFRLFRKVFIEGVAKYYENLKLGKTIFSEAHFQEIYDAEQRELTYIQENLDNAFSEIPKAGSSSRRGDLMLSDSFVAIVKKSWYLTGYHMVYTILFVDHKTTFEQVLHSQPFEFIRKYEECMKIKGLQPVISVTSGNGILDYKLLLAKLTAAVRELRRTPGK